MQKGKKIAQTTPALVPLTAEMCNVPLEIFIGGVDDFQDLCLDMLFVLDDALNTGQSCDFSNHQISRYYKTLAFFQQLSKLQNGKDWC